MDLISVLIAVVRIQYSTTDESTIHTAKERPYLIMLRLG